ncbi:MAG: hypothetical protein PVJ76_11880 [Gemmatimonadota bacterium]
MVRDGRRDSRSPTYYLGFGFTALALGGLTLFLVLVVLPRRYVLSAGLRESGVTFPSEAAPFSPPEEHFTEAPPPPPPPAPPVRGPAEVFWSEVGPLLETRRFLEALPLFEAYLADSPDDQGVLKEYALTLQKAGFMGEAVLILDDLLSRDNDPTTRLLLARALRDRGRLEEASTQYGILLEEDSSNSEIILEWGGALAWAEEYEWAAEVLTSGLAVDSASADLRIALSQVYYWSGQLGEADRVLSELDEEALEAAGGLPLRREILAALTPPEADSVSTFGPSPALTIEERIALARAEEDYARAAQLLREILLESPEDTTAWRAYADVLQFGLEDLEGTREALLSLEGILQGDPGLSLRLARLEFWTGRNVDATDRLEALLRGIDEEGVRSAEGADRTFRPAEVAEIHAMVGDLYRWRGDRPTSGDRYQIALDTDPSNERALVGIGELGSQAAEEMEEWETPGAGGNAYSLSDSDDFRRVDLGVQGKSINEHWVWGFRTGSRWLGGFDLGGSRENQQGLFLELESGRWWRWGTIRTGIHFGIEEMGPGSRELSYGGSLHFSDLGGFRSDFRYDHGPAYPLTMTLQSVRGDVTLDRFTANLARGIGDRWSLSLAGDVAWLDTQGDGATSREGSLRLEGGASLGRLVTDHLSLGVNARALTYSEASPLVDNLRLFWDPRAVVSTGVYAQWNEDLSEAWAVRARFNPSLAFIDERIGSGFETIPHFSGEFGLTHEMGGFHTALDGFYYQGRADGYRAYGLRISVSARDWFRKEEGP